MRKAQIWVSLIIYVLIIVSVIVIVLKGGLPLIEQMRDKIIFSRARDSMANLDEQIRLVASEGIGSQRIIPFTIRDGSVSIDNNRMKWEIVTENEIIESKTKVDLGNIVITSNSEVSAKEENNLFVLKNSYLAVNISKLGGPNPNDWVALTTNDIIDTIGYNGNVIQGSNFNFSINGLGSSGNGFTQLLHRGTDLGSATVIAHINSSDGFEYDLELTLDSFADYLTVKVKNFQAT
ncbi:hypothetical protein D6745_03435 [Candidatus Woesearchaeota archaeon]|nr:MAG: hypothetical protein D6745_03435 [Candidatus Woesearchaeota archaeon]